MTDGDGLASLRDEGFVDDRPAASGDRGRLMRVVEVMGLSEAELASMFGLSPEDVTRWLDGSMRPEHQAKISTVSQIAALLDRHLASGKVPEVVRRQSPAYDGRSMLQMIGDDEQGQLLAITERSFDWAATE